MKPKELHTKESRRELVDNIIQKLKVLGLYSMEFPAIHRLNVIMNIYAERGDHFQGKIKFPESQNRTIIYQFSNLKSANSFVNLKYIGGKK